MFQKNSLNIETRPMGSYACNTTLIYSTISKEAIIIDPGNDFDSLDAWISPKNLIIKYLLHTHAHFDHIGHSAKAAEKYKAPIYLHHDDDFLYQALAVQGQFFGQKVDAPKPLDGLLKHQQTFSLTDPDLKEFLKCFHTPGHTPGSCCFYTEGLETPLLMSGDTLFRGSIGRTDLPGGDSDLILSSIKKELYQLPEETMVITGHGPMTRIFEEKKTNPFVRA
ncbi:MAG: MBL fold metallo-hydrolase [Bdellovibrio sp. CG12_big_fil_rev_8_21_14_0_65_39_13]|nr:MAG: MBL fold metallo-hydrolase [Bdellovibrio sp. CG22_combo_CG10-13_8_21_14_all_39_27]PIQ62929.1 MAG: MBL fold metallo-hydrolase [Bdellovibrio sp. CG12_big_fil_rev_8_21_14_0_65_39_13]PIR35115.1 MAG: MBL fold metallo-hydrolase [Bdellovibrio sp. CG11_big_fil_rev_8_21_14_0_20_39_38]